jgi:hypothetical protein
MSVCECVCVMGECVCCAVCACVSVCMCVCQGKRGSACHRAGVCNLYPCLPVQAVGHCVPSALLFYYFLCTACPRLPPRALADPLLPSIPPVVRCVRGPAPAPATAPAAPGVSGGVGCTLPLGSFTGFVCAALDMAQLAAGGVYFNVHTNANPSGAYPRPRCPLAQRRLHTSRCVARVDACGVWGACAASRALCLLGLCACEPSCARASMRLV